MIDISTFGIFAAAALALLLTPGPAVMYVIMRSVEQGRVAGLVSVAGICAGTLFHVAAAALGISVLLASSAVAFGALRDLGAAYLRAEKPKAEPSRELSADL
jgi:threonine/homoserine/homoserine lactone efflux protein